MIERIILAAIENPLGAIGLLAVASLVLVVRHIFICQAPAHEHELDELRRRLHELDGRGTDKPAKAKPKRRWRI